MSWRLGTGMGVLLAATIAAVVIAIMSAGGPGDAERIKGAVRWPTNCTPITVDQPSRDPIVRRWVGSTTQTADITCGGGPHVAYAKFKDRASLGIAIAQSVVPVRYCVIGEGIAIDRLGADDASVFTDMCRNLGGTFSLST